MLGNLEALFQPGRSESMVSLDELGLVLRTFVVFARFPAYHAFDSLLGTRSLLTCSHPSPSCSSSLPLSLPLFLTQR